MSRFQIGEKVFVRVTTARHSNNEATVVAIEISQHSRPGVTSLDKYIVRFSNGELAEFFDIHLGSEKTQIHKEEIAYEPSTKESETRIDHD